MDRSQPLLVHGQRPWVYEVLNPMGSISDRLGSSRQNCRYPLGATVCGLNIAIESP